VRLSPSVSPQFTVFLNGVRQEAGTYYHVEDDTLVFERELARNGPDGRQPG
jgi:hypothetical protein